MKDTIVILNPAARSDRAQRLARASGGNHSWIGIVCDLAYGEAEALARNAAAEGFQTIVAAGGDGTIHEVVNGLAGTDAALGLLPLGTMNVFATELGLPANDLGRCWQIIQRGALPPDRSSKRERETFCPARRGGLDAQVVKETSRNFKRQALGRLATSSPRRKSLHGCLRAS